MIIDDNLIQLFDSIIPKFKTTAFLLTYKSEMCEMKCINSNRTAILKIVVEKEVLRDYPKGVGCYVLPVKGNHYCDEHPVELDFKGYHTFNFDNERDMILLDLLSGSIMDVMVDNSDYCNFPFDVLQQEMYDVDHAFEMSCNPSISFRHKKNSSTISTSLLQECIFGDVEKIAFKVLSSDAPLYLRYNTVFEDLVCSVYGGVAPRIDTKGDNFIRLC